MRMGEKKDKKREREKDGKSTIYTCSLLLNVLVVFRASNRPDTRWSIGGSISNYVFCSIQRQSRLTKGKQKTEVIILLSGKGLCGRTHNFSLSSQKNLIPNRQKIIIGFYLYLYLFKVE